MTKAELRQALENGAVMVDLFTFSSGQECEIFKSKIFVADDEICYIPDTALNEIPMARPVKDTEEIAEVLSSCYTGKEFVEQCDGDMEAAKALFSTCDWQHPSSAYDDGFHEAFYGEDDEQDSDENDRTYIATELCPHCMNEVEMRWDTDTMGFKAFCPVCGERLMLCDECRHCEDAGGCDYDSTRDCCKHNPPDAEKKQELRVQTPLGEIVAYVSSDPNHPGIYIDLARAGEDSDIPLALVEFAADEGDFPEGEKHIITRVWGDTQREDYTDRVVHKGFNANRYYYTFGSNPVFPYQNGWVIVKADSWAEALRKLQARFPDRNDYGTINCACFYSEKQWNNMSPEQNWAGWKCYEIIE